MPHTVFNLEYAIEQNPLGSYLQKEGRFGGYSIGSGTTAALTEQLRRTLRLYEDCEVVGETDILVPVPAECDCLGTSRVGGVPLMEDDEPWPLCSHSGERLKFVAQIALADSLDLLGPVPTDLILLFSEASRDGHEWCAGEFTAIWSRSKAPLRKTLGDQDILSEQPFASFHRWRAAQFDESSIRRLCKRHRLYRHLGLSELAGCAEPHRLGPLQGIRIGGIHAWIQHPADFDEFIFEFDSVDLNHSDLMVQARQSKLPKFVIPGDGQVYVGMTNDRSLTCEVQCY